MDVTETWRQILREEHEGAEGSFQLTLRCEARWDSDRFAKLFDAMLACCKAHDDCQMIERWICEVFWTLSWWPQLQPGAVGHDDEIVNFDHLAWWLFAKLPRKDDEFETVQ